MKIKVGIIFKTLFFDIKGYLEISVLEILRVD